MTARALIERPYRRMNGIFIIDKPDGMTSHDVVQAIRKKFHMSKVGHLGTLDPMATGVLPVALGQGTRVAQFVSNSPKEYEGEIRFGFATNTYDREGLPTTEEQPLRSTHEEIATAVSSFTGIQDQTPPPFSAKKIGGVPSHKLARKNQAIAIAPARIEVNAFEMTRLNGELMTFRVVCSAGTYIRSLAHDLGNRLGCGAHLTELRRTRSGNFRIQQAVRIDDVTSSNLISIASLLEWLPRLDVSGIEETRIAHGNPVRSAADSDLVRIFNKEGDLIAVASVENGWARPRVVLT